MAQHRFFKEEGYHLPTEDELFAQTFQFIKKNKKIPEFIERTKEDDPKVKQLLNAIQKGNAEDPIFKNKECYLYLLYLMKNKLIPYWHGITVYVYLLARMSLMDDSLLKDIDKDLKLNMLEEKKGIETIKIQHLAKDGKLTETGHQYIKKLGEKLAFLKITEFKMDSSKLEEVILSLPPSEQWLIRVDDIDASEAHPYFVYRDQILRELFFVSYEERGYSIPSMSITLHLLKLLSPQPLLIQPIFGTISEETEWKMHRKHLHSCQLYAFDVLSNLCLVHGKRTGPLMAWLHDLTHVVMGTRLTFAGRNQITEFADMLPIEEIAKLSLPILPEEKEPGLVRALKYIKEAAFDYVVHPDAMSAQAEEKATLYLSRIVNGFNNVGGLKSGTAQQLLFVLANCLQNKSLSEQTKSLVRKLINGLKEDITSHAESPTENLALQLDSIIRMSANSSGPCIQEAKEDTHMDWGKWHALFQSSNDSATLWEKAWEDGNEFTVLITYHQLQFFHPLLPLNEARLDELRKFIEQKALAQRVEPSHRLS